MFLLRLGAGPARRGPGSVPRTAPGGGLGDSKPRLARPRTQAHTNAEFMHARTPIYPQTTHLQTIPAEIHSPLTQCTSTHTPHSPQTRKIHQHVDTHIFSQAPASRETSSLRSCCFRTSKLQTPDLISGYSQGCSAITGSLLQTQPLTLTPQMHTHPLGESSRSQSHKASPPLPLPQCRPGQEPGHLLNEGSNLAQWKLQTEAQPYRILVLDSESILLSSPPHACSPFLLQTKLLQPRSTPRLPASFFVCTFCLFVSLFCSPSPCLSPLRLPLLTTALCVFPNSSFPAAFTLSLTFLQPGPDPVSLCSNAETADP